MNITSNIAVNFCAKADKPKPKEAHLKDLDLKNDTTTVEKDLDALARAKKAELRAAAKNITCMEDGLRLCGYAVEDIIPYRESDFPKPKTMTEQMEAYEKSRKK